MRFNGTLTLLGFGRNTDDPCLTGRSKYLPFDAGCHQRAIGARIIARYDHWGDRKPEFAACKNGHLQSPIDIRSPQQAKLPAIEINYEPSPLHIVENGDTIMINYAPGSFIRVGGKHCELKQVWSSGSGCCGASA
jgi:hypothetical protein